MRYLNTVFVSLAAVWAIGCGEQAMPTAAQDGSDLPVLASVSTGVKGLDLICFAGPCDGAAGLVNITFTQSPVPGAGPGFGISPLGVYTLRGAPPNTTYLVQRAFDPILDGICTGLMASWPYLPGVPPGPDPVRLTTSSAGAGAAHVSIQIPFVAKGAAFDGVFRLIEESPNAGATELRTACVQVTTR